MSGTEGQRTPTLETDWEDLTDEHQSRREEIENSIRNWPEEITQASYIIGAIGAGKTQLLSHLFRYSYANTGKPALYVTMGQLLDDLESHDEYPETGVISQEKLHDLMEDVARSRLDDINSTITDEGNFDRGDYLLDAGRLSDVKKYADILGISKDEFSEIATQSDEIILIVDEMEESYNRLGEMVAQTTGPLREVVERVERGNSSFYLIGGFGYASVHELGEAEYRRVNPVTLPIIKPQSIPSVLASEITPEQRNFIWWMSRGRPGWLEIANSGYEMRPDGLQGSYNTLADIPNLAMSRVDIIALEELEEYLQDLTETERDLTAATLFTPAPTQIKNMAGLTVDELATSDSPVLTDSGTESLDAVADAFLAGTHRFDKYDDAVVSDQLVRRFLIRILRGISNSDGELVFGAAQTPMFQRGTICKDRMLAPLAERIHDIALEESGDGEEETVDFLYELLQFIQSTTAEELAGEFGKFFDLFSESDELTTESYVGPGLQTLVVAFPSLITNPRLNFAATGQSVTEQFANLAEQLEDHNSAEQRLREFGQILQGESQ
ncbi:hypothetical protein [Natranaeroarchaeum aerophilus]|uniref:Uncharacterized protein n=1 Tax=Natranaeroarchaeum aerophilus TaxID=2917711 RepID=A0AAE3FRL5_9EURY|nr:hypothetical protein [Natranaeroarchaeum aerophilus]MCL9814357.1 hypothetical protein [Natranaeroarchaeum aerophilus]